MEHGRTREGNRVRHRAVHEPEQARGELLDKCTDIGRSDACWTKC